jgi:LacI family transcriptional regulator
MSSVSRVLSDHPDVSPKLRARVLEAVVQLGYEPDYLAQSLRRGATLSVGFVMADISNPLMAEIASGAEAVFQEAGYSMVLMNAHNEERLESSHIRFLTTRRVDGMLLSLSSESSRPTQRLLTRLDVPYVLIERELPPRFQAPSVVSDHRSGIRTAVSELIELGHRRFGLLTGSLDIRSGRERLAGMREALEIHGLDAGDGIAVSIGLSPANGERATEDLLDLPTPPTAIIAGGNQLLVGTLRALAKRNLKVGEDIALVAVDEVPITEFHSPPIAVVARDSTGLGRAAAELLLQRMRGEPSAGTVVLPTTFVWRPSCSPPRVQPVT